MIATESLFTILEFCHTSKSVSRIAHLDPKSPESDNGKRVRSGHAATSANRKLSSPLLASISFQGRISVCRQRVPGEEIRSQADKESGAVVRGPLQLWLTSRLLRQP